MVVTLTDLEYVLLKTNYMLKVNIDTNNNDTLVQNNDTVSSNSTESPV